jgi:hypothetical protein
MKFLYQILTIFLSAVLMVSAATQPQKSVIVSFPKDTPTDILDKAKEAVLTAGGMITHEYTIIK